MSRIRTKTEQQATLADTGVADEQELEEHITAEGGEADTKRELEEQMRNVSEGGTNKCMRYVMWCSRMNGSVPCRSHKQALWWSGG